MLITRSINDDEEADDMAHARLKVVIGGLTIFLAVAYLVVAGIRDGWVYSYKVDQIVDVASYEGKRLRLHGVVGDDDLVVDRSGLSTQFALKGDERSVRVDYSGVIPDLFKPDHEVVVEGYLDEDGIFRADTLLTKCASKYESKDGEAPFVMPEGHEATGSVKDGEVESGNKNKDLLNSKGG